MTTLSRYVRIDWPRVVENLMRCGMTRQEIADSAEIGYGTVRTYLDQWGETEPAYWVGVRLLALWAEKTGCEVKDAPTRRVSMSVSQALRD